MRKVKRARRVKKHTGMLMMAAMLACGLTACQSTQETNTNGSETLAVSEQESLNSTSEENAATEETQTTKGGNEQAGSGQEQQQSRYMGEIAAIEDNRITVNVMGGGQFPGVMPGGKMPDGEISEGKMPENIQPAEIPEGAPAEGELPKGFEPGEMPEGFEPGNKAEGFESGEIPEGFEFSEMPEGESMVIEVSDDTVITVNDENGEVANLKVGDFIQFTMNGELVTEINVGMMQQNVPQQKTEEGTKTE